jgi:hypothetical protein
MAQLMRVQKAEGDLVIDGNVYCHSQRYGNDQFNRPPKIRVQEFVSARTSGTRLVLGYSPDSLGVICVVRSR